MDLRWARPCAARRASPTRPPPAVVVGSVRLQRAGDGPGEGLLAELAEHPRRAPAPTAGRSARRRSRRRCPSACRAGRRSGRRSRAPASSSWGEHTPRSSSTPSTGSTPSGPSSASSSPASPLDGAEALGRRRAAPGPRRAPPGRGPRRSPRAPAASSASACPPPPSVPSTRRFPGPGFKSCTASSRRTVWWTNGKGRPGASVKPGVVALRQRRPGVAGVAGRSRTRRGRPRRGGWRSEVRRQRRRASRRRPRCRNSSACETSQRHAPVVEVAHVAEVQHQPDAAPVAASRSIRSPDGAERVAVQLAHAGAAVVCFSRERARLRPRIRLLRRLGHVCSLPLAQLGEHAHHVRGVDGAARLLLRLAPSLPGSTAR